MAYIVSYVIPFIDLPFDDWKATISSLIFFLMLMIIYINSHMIHINPTLNVMGFHLLEVETGGEVHSLITRKRYLPRGSKILVHKLGNGILLEAKK